MGAESDERELNDMWQLDVSGAPGTESWSRVRYAEEGAPPPEPRSFHRMTAVGADLFVFGGCGAGGRFADLHKFDTATRAWTPLGTSPVLAGRGGANLIALRRAADDASSSDAAKLAVIAGFAGKETNDGHAFCGRWADAPMDGLSELRPRSVCVAAAVPSKGVALVFGGEVDPSERGHEGALLIWIGCLFLIFARPAN